MGADSALSDHLDKEAGLLLAVALERLFPDLEHVEFLSPAVNCVPDRCAFLDRFQPEEAGMHREHENHQVIVIDQTERTDTDTEFSVEFMEDSQQQLIFCIIGSFLTLVDPEQPQTAAQNKNDSAESVLKALEIYPEFLFCRSGY